ncbi:MAG: helix-turn-helix domain-containing protein [Burkholderiaceae bacterium]
MEIQTRYDTSDVPDKDRCAYWQEAVCDSYVRLGCEVTERQDFSGVIELSRYSMLAISRVSGTPHIVRRRKSDIRQATDQFFLLSLQTKNASSISQFGQTASLKVGDMALYSSTDPYTLEMSKPFSQMVVQLPKEKLLARLPNADMLTARTIDGQSGIGQLVRQNILSFAGYANASNELLQTLVQETLVDLIATGLAAHDGSRCELSSPEQHVMLRAKSFIRNNLGSPALDRQVVANEVGMSVRRLNAIFAKENKSPGAYIRLSRLEAVASELCDARFSSRSISEIALKYGFENFQHFSTSFRSHFGLSPREYRAGANLH